MLIPDSVLGIMLLSFYSNYLDCIYYKDCVYFLPYNKRLQSYRYFRNRFLEKMTSLITWYMEIFQEVPSRKIYSAPPSNNIPKTESQISNSVVFYKYFPVFKYQHLTVVQLFEHLIILYNYMVSLTGCFLLKGIQRTAISVLSVSCTNSEQCRSRPSTGITAF